MALRFAGIATLKAAHVPTEGLDASTACVPSVAQKKQNAATILVSAIQGSEKDGSRGAVTVGDQGSAELLWQKYLKNPAEWRDNRKKKVHPNSADFRHKTTKKGLWIDNRSTPQWVTEVPDCKAGESGSTCYGECNSLPHRDQFTWTALISQSIKRGQCRQALRIYEEMRGSGVKPNSYTFVAALKACSSLRDLQTAMEIHAQVVESGFQSDVYAGTMLVDVYVKCGSLQDARRVFEKMPHRNVVSWNAMILGYAQMEQGDVALQLYRRMQQENVVPNDRTFVSALKACSSLAASQGGNPATGVVVKRGCLEQVRGIHSHAVETGSELNVFVGTMLVDAYAKCGSLVDARRIFENMPRHDVVSWNAMILGHAQMEDGEEALKLYARMRQEVVVPDVRTFVAALKACSSLAASEDRSESDGKHGKERCLEQVKAIHLEIVKRGSESQVIVGNMLVDVYGKCGSLVNARRVFERMPHRDVVSWNAMILGYAQMEEGEEALQLYAQMQQGGVLLDNRTFVGALKACISLAVWKEIKQSDGTVVKTWCIDQVRSIHSDIVKNEAETDVFVGTMLVDAYVKCGSLMEARDVFEKILHHDVVSWTAMISGYAQMEEGEMALELYTRMQQEGVVPNSRTFISAVKACGSLVWLEKGKEVHAQIAKARLEATDSFVASSLIDMYGKCGSMKDAQSVFDALPTRDIVTWNTLIAGYARQGNSEVVFDLFEKMKHGGIAPAMITFLIVLTLCSHVGLVDEGQKYFKAMSTEFGISPTIEHYSCIVDLLARAGQVEKAMAMVKTMPFPPDNALWKTVLGACRNWNRIELGRQAFECAVRLDRNDAAAYDLMSNIYASALMWEEAKEIQAMRVKAGAWKQRGRSWYTDIDGSLHAFGVGDQNRLWKPTGRDIIA